MPTAAAAAAIPWAAYACLAGSMALVGTYVGLSRQLVAVLPVFLLAWLRFGIAAVAMLPWLKRRPGEAPLGPRERRLLFWESFLGNFGFSVCMLFGVALTSALSAGIVMSTIPAVVALLSRLVLGEPIRPRVIGSIGLAVFGMALLAFARTPIEAGGAPAGGAASGLLALLPSPAWGPPLGHALLLGAVVCEASYVVIGKRLSARVSPQRISALINLWGLALVTPFGLWQLGGFDLGTVPAGTWALLVFYAIAASMVTVWLWMRGLQRVPAARAGVFTVCLPLAAAAVGIGWLGEPAGWAHAAAFAFGLAGLLLATWPDRAAAPGARPADLPAGR